MLEKLPLPAVIAHRGASAHAPENTPEAFRLAVKLQADALEIDIRLTADDQPVVIHDRSLDRTTSLSGLVSQVNFSELRAHQSAGAKSGSDLSTAVPHLREVLQDFSPDIPLNIELKSVRLFPNKLVSAVSEVIRDFPAADVLISSFNPLVLSSFHRALPRVPAGLVLTRRSFPIWARSGLLKILPISSVHPYYRDVSTRMITFCRTRGLKVFPYTVNDPRDITQLVQLGADGIITDDPGAARTTLERLVKVE
jgi:glycerophosphoryl diester phosphodiesterase